MLSHPRLFCIMVSGGVALSCGNPPPAQTPQPDPSASRAGVSSEDPVRPERPQAEEPGEKQATGDDSKGQAAASAEPSAGSPPPAETETSQPGATPIADLCGKICQRVEKRCPERTQACRDDCAQYAGTAEACDSDLRRALRCQSKSADKWVCSSQPDPNCAQAFRNLSSCQKTGKSAGQPATETAKLPASWTKVRDDELKFAVSLPPGAELDAKAERRTWRAEENGIAYWVAALPAPRDVADRTLVAAVIGYVGHRCQLRLKVHGRLEIKGRTLIAYDSACPDRTEWHGMLHIWRGKAVSTAFHAPPGAAGVMDPYFYSFEPTD